ncbi:MAG: glycosyltransferase family A protein [Bacteroidota bacterium]
MTIFAHQGYLDKHRFLPRQVGIPPLSELKLVVVIPVFKEPNLLETLASLEACHPPQGGVEVLLVFNASTRHASEIISLQEQGIAQVQAWITQLPRAHTYHILSCLDLPPKHAGVGLARKIGLDEAVDRLQQAGQAEGILACLDGDSLVEPTYLQCIEEAFRRRPRLEALSIRFAHPLEGSQYEASIYQGIIRYELFLRYYVEGLRKAGFPFAFHAVGSAMAVRAQAYQKYGGMNRRKAGEDFYFLQKFMAGEQLAELQNTLVIPSPRPSDRVPFGTGKAIQDWLNGEQKTWETYDPRAFEVLRTWIQSLPAWREGIPTDLPAAIYQFLEQENFSRAYSDIRQHAKDEKRFRKRYFQWLDGLKVLKFIHFLHEEIFSKLPLLEAVAEILPVTNHPSHDNPYISWLTMYRDKQASQSWQSRY